MTDLAAAVVAHPEDNGVRIGTVTAVTPLAVSLNGGPVLEPGVLSSYAPTVGDTVAMLRQGATWLLLGSVYPANEGPAWTFLPQSELVTTTEGIFMSVTREVRAGQVVRAAFTAQCLSNGADRQTTCRLKEDGVTICTRQVGSPVNNLNSPMQGERLRRLPAGIYTWTLTAQMSAFTGNLQADAELSVTLAG